MEIVFQPIVDTARGTVAGYEALCRFPGFVEKNPEVWFATARRLGMSARLEAMALRLALEMRPLLPSNCFLTLNVSPELLATQEIRSLWSEQGNLGGLIIELTEQSRIESYVDLEPDLDRLRSAGALIAVDDAGAGYAGLRHLLALKPALIKIDRELVQGVDRDEAKRALIRMLGMFASQVDAWLLAEGVETVEELDVLASLGIPLVQGYVLARPAPAWASLEVDIAHRLASRHVSSSGNILRNIMEPAKAELTVNAALSAFQAYPLLEHVVLLEAHNRPVALLSATEAQLGVVSPGMRVNLDTPAIQALQRAITRPESSRFQPLMVTDNAGRFVGIARMERLITALSEQVSSEN